MTGDPGDGTGGASPPDAWSVIGLLLGGLLVWGGIGYLLDRWLGFRALFLPIGLIVGAIGSTWLVVIRYARQQR
jgi:ATP synthase protein I